MVRPAGPANVGSVCRVMANMGLHDLVLVAPQCDLADPLARQYAVRAVEVLQGTRCVPSISDALADCAITFATSAKGGLYRRQASVDVSAAVRQALMVGPPATAAFVFGPEDQGLVLRDLLHFDRVIEIPADARYPTLNLAAAVTIVCYELRRAALAAGHGPLHAPVDPDSSPATAAHKDVLYQKLFSALERIGYFSQQQSPDHLKFALRRILGREPLTVIETDVLIGMAQQIAWFADDPARWGQPEV